MTEGGPGGRSLGEKVADLGLGPVSCSLLTLGSYLISLSLCFLSCEVGMMPSERAWVRLQH